MSRRSKLILFQSWNVFYVLETVITNFIFVVAPYYLFDFLREQNINKVILTLIIFILSRVIWGICVGYHKAIFSGFTPLIKLKNVEKLIQIFDKINLNQYKQKGDGFYLSEIRNINSELVEKYYASLLNIISNSLLLIATSAFGFYQSWILGTILVISFFIFLVFSYFIKPKLEKYYDQKNQAVNEFYEKTGNILNYLPAMYTLNKTQQINQLFSNVIWKNINVYKSFLKYKNLASFVSYNLNKILHITLGAAITIFFTIYYKDNVAKLLSNLSVVIFANIIFDEFYTDLSNFTDDLINWLQVKKSKNEAAKKLNSHFDIELLKDKIFPSDSNVFAIKIKDLSLKLEDKTLYNKMSLNIEKKQKYLLKGSNGSGKSTLAKILLGLNHNYEGNVEINNKCEAKSLDFHWVNKHFNYLGNNFDLVEGSLIENISLYEENPDLEKIDWLIKTLNLSSIDASKILGQEDDNDVSTGQMQRIALARNLYFKKDILIIDEGLSNIDKENLDIALNLLLNDKNLTLIYISHHSKLEQEQLFDQVINLD
ncbi:ATP-binding cassette domain-containing protein [Mycoplasma sp. 1654_15]|uniref:ATP-binding cassette domain-containing protein n=1 Tax=Mycoplasma sp. 1654_15 TaxID=2725994 RepID=UPI0014490C47|nr:ABC transporter ATP-binding protein [Mycoplasma sp. 1654_15]QJB71242.1 ABC transporter ATP-binding protein [Mycoplasma sp. 1654_15]